MMLLVAVGLFLLVVAFHAAACRMRVPGSRLVRFLVIGVCAGLLFAQYLSRREGAIETKISSLLVYALACELYIFSFTLAMASISANLLVALVQKKRSWVEIERLYDSRLMVEKRIERLVRVGLVEGSDSGLFVTRKGKRLTVIFGRFRRVFHKVACDGG